MLTQRLVYKADGLATLVIDAEPVAIGELVGLAQELELRSTVRTEGNLHVLSEGPTKHIPKEES